MKISDFALAPQSDLDELERLRAALAECVPFSRDACIEECARVADGYTKGGEELGTSGIHIKIAAAIRALKDSPLSPDPSRKV